MAKWLIPIPPWPKPAVAAEDCDIVLFVINAQLRECPLQTSDKNLFKFILFIDLLLTFLF